jgi:hypothetical protein
MLPWETAAHSASGAEPEREFARICQALPKVVFSRTLERVEGDARLVRDGASEEIARLKGGHAGDLAVAAPGSPPP